MQNTEDHFGSNRELINAVMNRDVETLKRIHAATENEQSAKRASADADKVACDVILKDVLPFRERKQPDRPIQRGGPDIVLPFSVGKPEQKPVPICGPNGEPLGANAVQEIVDVRGETLTSLSWTSYLAWRKTKCRPYDYETAKAMIGSILEPKIHSINGITADRVLEEIDQAIHEFVGEVAELSELFLANGPLCFFGPPLRDKLIDECGDILFCGCWVLDAYGSNPLGEMDSDDLEFIRVTDEDQLAVLARVIISADINSLVSNGRFMYAIDTKVRTALMTAQMHAGLLCNAYKKLRFQRREQNIETQVNRVASAFFHINQILIIANSSVEEALKVNQRKLDARFPNGYQPGQGGGNRTGKGA